MSGASHSLGYVLHISVCFTAVTAASHYDAPYQILSSPNIISSSTSDLANSSPYFASTILACQMLARQTQQPRVELMLQCKFECVFSPSC